MHTDRIHRSQQSTLLLKKKICKLLHSYQNIQPAEPAVAPSDSSLMQRLNLARLSTHKSSASERHKTLKELSASCTHKNKHPDRLVELVGSYKNPDKLVQNTGNDPYSAFENYMRSKEMGYILEDLNQRDKNGINLILTSNGKYLREASGAKLSPRPKYSQCTYRNYNKINYQGQSKFSLFAAKLDKIQKDARVFKHKIRLSTVNNYKQYQQIQKTISKAKDQLDGALILRIPSKLEEANQNS
jgi:hypothetical protein